jgi:hypothetical protein
LPAPASQLGVAGAFSQMIPCGTAAEAFVNVTAAPLVVTSTGVGSQKCRSSL